MTGTKRKSDLFRIIVCALLGLGAMGLAMVSGELTDLVDTSRQANLWIVGFLALWPTYTSAYVVWSSMTFSGLSDTELRETVLGDARNWDATHRSSIGRATTNTSISAATVAVIVTIVIAAQPLFRGEPVYVALALATVLCSWILMVVAFTRSYMLLSFSGEAGEHMVFSLKDEPGYGEFLTLALLISTMGATSPATIVSRDGWRLVRTNVCVAFLFNTVIMSMMVSLLFAGLMGGS